MAEPVVVALLAMGGPDCGDAVKPFLRNLFSDPLIFPLPGQSVLARIIAWRRTPRVKPLYEGIGWSPLNEITRRQAVALERQLGDGFRTVVAFRYWGPDARAAVVEIEKLGARRVVTLPMYPQYCKATTLSSLRDFEVAAKAAGLETLDIDRFFDDPAYLSAQATAVNEMLAEFPAGATPYVVFSAHGVPERLSRSGDPYVDEVKRTASAVAEHLPQGTPWRLTFQSRVGPVKWVEPYTDVVLPELGKKGVRSVMMVPITFVADHLETLDEMDKRWRKLALESGVRDFRRVPALNDDARFIEALAGLVRRRLESAT